MRFVVAWTRCVPIENDRENARCSLSGKQGPRYRHVAGDIMILTRPSASRNSTPIIGAEISGVDIGKLVSDDARSNRQMDEIHRALAENLVIFFRDQHISAAPASRLRPQVRRIAHPSGGAQRGDDPALMKIYADKDSPRANGEGWHTDVSCDVEPPMGSILYIKQCPPRGGDTLFANMYAAYEALSDRMKAYLDGLTALHDGEQTYRGLYANYGVADRPNYPRAEHPVVRTHPVTGKKALYVNRGFTRFIVGIPRDESDADAGLSLSALRRTRCSSAASAGRKTPSRSGTTAAPSTARCGTTGRTHRSGHAGDGEG